MTRQSKEDLIVILLFVLSIIVIYNTTTLYTKIIGVQNISSNYIN